MNASVTVAATRRADPRTGYYFAALNAIISGFAIYIQGQSVKLFSDATLYATLKNAVVGVALLIPVVFMASSRAEVRRLSGRQWGLLGLLAVVGGSVPYALFAAGLKLTTPVTSSLLNHAQFLIVAVLAIIFLGERIGLIVWLAMLALLVGTTLSGTAQQRSVQSLVWSQGTLLVAVSTLLFAAGFVLAKYLLRDLSIMTVMTAKMSGGAALLLGYVAVTGRLGAVSTLSATQWENVLATGLILLAFTITAFIALRHITVTAATAIPAAAPLITFALTAIATSQIKLDQVTGIGLGMLAAAAVVVFIFGMRREAAQAPGVAA
jgi:drug/metabolite transporter (DMT)-like permease